MGITKNSRGIDTNKYAMLPTISIFH